MRGNLFYILIFSSLLLSCAKPKKQNEIRSVELMRIGAWSDEGAILSIDSTLTYRYLDRTKKHSYIGTVSESFWDTLNNRVEALKFWNATFLPHENCKDCLVFVVILRWKNQERKILRAWNEPNDSLLTTLIWLNDSYKRIKLRQVDSLFKFEMRPPTLPDFGIKQVHFPPPIPKPKKKNTVASH
jgi:hypothetical protein